ETLLQIRELDVRAAGFGHQPGDIFPPGLGLTYALGELVARGLELLRAHLHRLALVFDSTKSSDIEGERSRREAARDRFDVISEELRIDHSGSLVLLGLDVEAA